MSDLDDAMEEHMAYIVLLLGRPFSFKDFLCFKVGENEHKITHGTFRNKIISFKKKQIVELAFNSGIAFYTLKGKPMTPNHTVVSSSPLNTMTANDPVYKMLQSLPLDKQSIHNIRLRFSTPKIWESLSLSNLHRNKRSNDIVIPAWSKDGALIQVKVHQTDVVSVIISCSLRPIALDFTGIITFNILLATTEERLRGILTNGNAAETQIQIPDYKTWIITMWHFGRDSLTEYAGEKFSITVEDAQHVLTRIYSKEFPNGKTRIRRERQEYPNKTVEQVQDKIVGIVGA